MAFNLPVASSEEIQFEIAERLGLFRSDLISLSPRIIMRKWLLHGTCFALDWQSYYNVRQVVADAFNVHSTEVVMVGSGKLGFSINPEHRYTPFCDESDFDIAIVSSQLYERIWFEIFDYYEERRYLVSDGFASCRS